MPQGVVTGLDTFRWQEDLPDGGVQFHEHDRGTTTDDLPQDVYDRAVAEGWIEPPGSGKKNAKRRATRKRSAAKKTAAAKPAAAPKTQAAAEPPAIEPPGSGNSDTSA